MIQITSIEEVNTFYNILQNDKKELAHIFPAIVHLNVNLIVGLAGACIFHLGQTTQNHYIILYGSVNAFIIKNTKSPPICHYHSHDPLLQSVMREMPQIPVLSKPHILSHEWTLLETLNVSDHFGETLHKRTYTTIVAQDCLLLEIEYDEKHWKLFEIRHQYLKKFDYCIIDKSLLSVCMKKQHLKYGDFIYKANETSEYIYLVYEGQVEFSIREINKYYKLRNITKSIDNQMVKLSTLTSLQMFGFEEMLISEEQYNKQNKIIVKRIFNTRCTSAELILYRIHKNHLDLFRILCLRELMNKRFQSFDRILHSRQQSSPSQVPPKAYLSNSLQIRQKQNNIEEEDYSTFVSLHWLKNLSLLPRWNEQQMIRQMGAIPGGIVKSNNFITPKSTQNEYPQRKRVSSMLEVNTDQYEEMLKTYSKRLRSEKYHDLHQCLQGQWERIFKKSEYLEIREKQKKKRESRQFQIVQNKLKELNI